MSLFKVCTWWTVQCSDCEANYDSQLLHCCRFGITEHEKDYVVVASHSGYLSVFQPNAQQDEASNEAPGFKPTDQLIEIQLPHPILQLSSGTFVSGPTKSSKRQLVVLHPFKLSVYEFQSTGGLTDHGIQYKLIICFEHKLTKMAYALCHGHFGGYKSCEFFCVTHMDGSLTFFEQDGISFETSLGGERNLPTKLIYNSRLDTFIVNSPYYELECYRYQDIGQTLEHTSTQTQSVISPMWSVCIGEYPLDIQIQQVTENECIILVLCENLLYGISDISVVKFIKRLDYIPMCMCSFVSGWYYEPDARLIITIISDNGTLLIYDLATLVWAAQLADTPVSMVRSNLSGLPGAICTLSETGKIVISYLGSDPQIFQVPPLNLQKLNFEKTQNELFELEKEIKAGVESDEPTYAQPANSDLSVCITLDERSEPDEGPSELPAVSLPSGEAKVITAHISLTANVRCDQIQVEWLCPIPLKASKSIHSIQHIDAEQSEQLGVLIYMENNFDVCSPTITVIVSYISEQGVPRVIEKTEWLPLSMFFKLCAPQKTADTRITISVDQVNAPSLDQLFMPDFQLDASQNAIAFQSIYTGRTVTIVAARSSNRYRIQADHIAPVASILQSLVHRIETAARKRIKITASPPLPLSSIMALVDEHFSAFEEIRKIREQLKECSMRLRLLERRFFTKLDDKKTGSIQSISAFLRATHQVTVKEIQALETAKRSFKWKQNELVCGLSGAAQLVKLLDAPVNITGEVGALLSCTVLDHSQQCWEEMVAPGLNYTNRVGALRKQKNGQAEDAHFIDIVSFEFERFKRHLTSLLDRIMHLATADAQSSDKDDGFQRPESVEEEDEETVTPRQRGDSDARAADERRYEESEWVSDVKSMMAILPKLADDIDPSTKVPDAAH